MSFDPVSCSCSGESPQLWWSLPLPMCRSIEARPTARRRYRLAVFVGAHRQQNFFSVQPRLTLMLGSEQLINLGVAAFFGLSGRPDKPQGIHSFLTTVCVGEHWLDHQRNLKFAETKVRIPENMKNQTKVTLWLTNQWVEQNNLKCLWAKSGTFSSGQQWGMWFYA